MPAGMLTSSTLFFLIRPAPLHAAQGSEITLPLPRQVGQVCWIEKNPCCMRTAPAPPHMVHVFGEVPGLAPEPWQVSQLSQAGTRMSVAKPLAACSSVISML